MAFFLDTLEIQGRAGILRKRKWDCTRFCSDLVEKKLYCKYWRAFCKAKHECEQILPRKQIRILPVEFGSVVFAKHIALICQGALESGKDRQVRKTLLLQSAVLLGKVEGYHKAHNDASSSHQKWPSGKGTVRCRLLKSSKYQKSRHLGPQSVPVGLA